MIYVFDTSSLIDLFNNFYESSFPSLWRNFDQLVASQQIVSVREAANEIKSHYKEDRLTGWIKQNPNVCEHFTIKWTNLEGFMEQEGWKF